MPSYPHLMHKENVVHSLTMTEGAEACNAKNVAIQAKDYMGADLTQACALPMYVSSDAAGQVIEAASCTLSLAIGTDGLLIPMQVDNIWLAVFEADGDLDVTITQTSGADTHYLNFVMPDGTIVTSPAIDFAA